MGANLIEQLRQILPLPLLNDLYLMILTNCYPLSDETALPVVPPW